MVQPFAASPVIAANYQTRYTVFAGTQSAKGVSERETYPGF
jgi:hypothetical protein